jgi:hypothetical protein
MIKNINGMPFDEELANHVAEVLSRETGRHYRLAPLLNGYGIEQDTQVQSSNVTDSAPPIFLRPAIQSQLWNVLFSLLALWCYVSMESLMILIGVDEFHSVVYNIFGKSFPWEKAVILLGWFSLIIAAVLGGAVFYNLASRSYMIGPKGVETTVGLFNKDDSRVEYKHVRGMRVRRSFFQRLLFYGTIEIATSGTEGSEIQFKHIAHPKKYMAILKERAKNA